MFCLRIKFPLRVLWCYELIFNCSVPTLLSYVYKALIIDAIQGFVLLELVFTECYTAL